MTEWRVEHAGVMEWAATYQGPPFHCILTDPPYNLDSITKRFGKPGSAPAKHGVDGSFRRVSAGFMGKKWDSNIAFRPETWVALAKHLHPGGFIMAFGGSRTVHRLATAMEDAGLVMHPVLGWACAQGMPKATRIDVPLDQGAGVEREKVGAYVARGYSEDSPSGDGRNMWAAGDVIDKPTDITAPATPLAAAWTGHRYGRQALRPALELIVCAQKPYEHVWSDDWAEFSGWDWWHYPKRVKNTPKGRLKILKKYGVRVPAAHVEYQLWLVRRKSLRKEVESDTLLVWRDERQDRERPTEERVIGRAAVNKHRRWKIKTAAACIAMTGAGAFNIDAARLTTTDAYNINRWDDGAKPFGGGAGHPYTSVRVDPTRAGEASADRRYADKGGTNFAATPGPRGGSPKGRWPPNLCLVHHPECERVGERAVRGITGGGGLKTPGKHGIYGEHKGHFYEGKLGYADADGMETVDDWECVEGCPVLALNQQAGPRKSGYMKPGQQRKASRGKGGYHDSMPDEATAGGTYGDKGPTSRYFFNTDWQHEVAEQLAAANPVFYQGKAGKREKEAGLDALPVQNFGQSGGAQSQLARGETEYKGTGSIGLNVIKKRRNTHPTAKPIALTEWLATLLLPPAEYAPRRVLVPFGGVMSEAIGCLLAGWEEIVAVELEAEYCEIGRVRMAWWSEMAERYDGVTEILAASKKKPPAEANGQMSIFDVLPEERNDDIL